MNEIKKKYIDNYKGILSNGSTPKEITELRKKALSSFNELEFPSLKDEEWKYTNISPLLQHNFTVEPGEVKINEKDLQPFLFKEMKSNILVFVNGHFSEELSELKSLAQGVIVSDIGKAIKEVHPAVKKYFGQIAGFNDNIFVSLSTAFTKSGAFIYVPAGKIVEEPIHILFISSSKNKVIVQPRNLFVAEENSQVSILEHYVSLGSETYFTNAVTEIAAGENAVIDHIKLQEENKKSFHIARMEVHQERSSNFTSHSISFGALFAKNDFNTRFNDEGSECTLNGLYMIEGEQFFDAHTLIDHAMPHCNSHEHYKGILNDKSRGVFNGKVMVRKDAQKTNAFQQNNNILLSDEALVNTKPQLEIFADDVKCSHGATIGQLDKDSMFYLKTRGISKEWARTILIHAFASDVVKSLKMNPVREYVEKIITLKLGF
jgi:Fe-S cluster assembly protein SufD